MGDRNRLAGNGGFGRNDSVFPREGGIDLDSYNGTAPRRLYYHSHHTGYDAHYASHDEREMLDGLLLMSKLAFATLAYMIDGETELLKVRSAWHGSILFQIVRGMGLQVYRVKEGKEGWFEAKPFVPAEMSTQTKAIVILLKGVTDGVSRRTYTEYMHDYKGKGLAMGKLTSIITLAARVPGWDTANEVERGMIFECVIKSYGVMGGARLLEKSERLADASAGDLRAAATRARFNLDIDSDEVAVENALRRHCKMMRGVEPVFTYS